MLQAQVNAGPLAPGAMARGGAMVEESDDELLHRAGRGDRAAFAVLVTRHVRRAAAIAGRIVGNAGDAEEIVQEAFLKTWLKAPDWEAQTTHASGARFSTWFYRVLVNLSIDRKRRPRLFVLEAAGDPADPGPDAFDEVAGGETARRVREAVGALPERQRAALTLCHFEGMSNAEAAQVLEVSVGALESLLVRARRNLRDTLADLMEPSGGPSGGEVKP